jgi:pyruvate/2-oxoglutarate dehydrogenase complex dihydrolipoamide acyltransferase (E2) component
VIRRLVVPKELGEGIEVRLLQWYKSEGDAVAPDDALLEFETDKAIVLVQAKEPGLLRKCFYAAGDWMSSGDVAGWLSDEPDEPLPAERDAPAEVLVVAFDAT